MGFKFDSSWEAERYGQLYAMQKAGVVKDLDRQVLFDIDVNGQRICRYYADFVYTLINEDGSEEKIVEDAKGIQTTDFIIKKKLIKAIYNINIKISKKK
jgi:hypothetical protein